MRLTRHPALLGAAVMMILAASCSSDSDDDSSATSAAPSTSASAASTPAETTPPAETTAETSAETETTTESTSAESTAVDGLTVAISTTPLGDILVDQDGKTLYLFQNDTQGSGASVCGDGCVATWPPLTADAAPTAGDGVEAGELTLITRADGTMQVAYFGWPLYYFANDAAAGDTNGQGIGSIWWVVDAEGNPVGAG